METKDRLKYIKAKKKVEVLKALYKHILVYIIVNIIIIMISANILGKGEIDLANWENYFTAILWGIGLFFHILWVMFYFNFNNNYIKRWEERKIREILDKQE